MAKRGSTGPCTRTPDNEAHLQEQCCRVILRQQISHARRASLTLIVEEGSLAETESSNGSDKSPQRGVHHTTVTRHVNRISRDLIAQLLHVNSIDLQVVILQKVFTDVYVRPLFLEYYPSPADALAEKQILVNIRAKLQQIKIIQTSRKLARKCTILEAIVS